MDTSQISSLAPKQPAALSEQQLGVGQQDKAKHSTSVEDVRAAEQAAAAERNKPKPNDEQPKEMDHEQLQAVTEQMDQFMASLNRNLRFDVHEESGRDFVSVIDRSTDEVIRQIPSEEMLEIVADLSKASGLFVKTEV